MRIGAVVAAAGLSSRMGAFKPLLDLDGETLIRRGVNTLLRVGVEPLVVVTGRGAAQIAAHLSDLPVETVHNPDYAESQMLDSIKLGLSELQDRADRVLILPGDAPVFSEATVRLLLAREEDMCCPSCGGKKGHPVSIRAGLIPKILAYTGEGGLAGAMASLGTLTLVENDDAGILLDADTPEDYAKMLGYVRETKCARST